MFIKLFFIAAVASSALSRNIPRYSELDEEDQVLFRAAYDAPYEQEDYYEEEGPGKFDLLKSGMLSFKTQLKEMKAFDKAIAAHLLATKLKFKQLLTSLKKHPVEKKKPAYNYQNPPYTPPAYNHEPPHYSQNTPPKYDPPTPAVQYPQEPYDTHQYIPPPPAPQYVHDPYYGY